MKKARDKHLSYYKESNFLRYKQFHLERDLLRIAYSLFEAEKELKVKGYVDNIEILLSKESIGRVDVVKLKAILEELFLLILLEDVNVIIQEVDDIEGRVRKEANFPKKEAIILFSAGVDSYSGVKISEKRFKSLLGLFIAHNDQTRIIEIVEKMKHSISTEIRTIYAPGMSSMSYSQLRGFVYILAAGVYANLCQSRKILVTECGPTMYQPIFSPYDEITYTTHPYVLKAAKDVLHLFLSPNPEIIIPFEDLTKAEVIANAGTDDFRETHSCITQRFGDHDGTCFGCVIKKLACIVSGAKDVMYKQDVFDDKSKQDNLLNILEFSAGLLNGYDKMPAFETEKIFEFNKFNLFQRFALDNLAGLMIGADKRNILVHKFVHKKRLLQNRIMQVRKISKRPNFSNVVR